MKFVCFERCKFTVKSNKVEEVKNVTVDFLFSAFNINKLVFFEKFVSFEGMHDKERKKIALPQT